MVQIRLNKLGPGQAQKTIFNSIQLDEKKDDFNKEELIVLFTRPEVEKKNLNTNLSAQKVPEKKEIELGIDPKRNMELGIFLTKHPIDLNVLLHSITSFTISSTIDEKFYQLLPEKFMIRNEKSAIERDLEKNACETFRLAGGKVDKLTFVQRFVYTMWTIPRLPERMKIFSFKLDWQLVKTDALNNAEVLYNSLKELESDNFKNILKIVMLCASTLNSSQVKSFTLSSLSKLRDVKSPVDKNLSMLHFLAKVMQKNTPPPTKIDGSASSKPAGGGGNPFDWVDKMSQLFKSALTAVAAFQGVFPTILDNLLEIEKESLNCTTSDDSKFKANLTDLKKQIVSESIKLNEKRKTIDDRILFLGSNKNDQPDDENIKQIRSMWNKYNKIIPNDLLKTRIEHDEGTYTFFNAMVVFFDDLKKAKIYLDSMNEKPKTKHNNSKKDDTPTARALKKRMAQVPTTSGTELSPTTPSSANSPVTIEITETPNEGKPIRHAAGAAAGGDDNEKLALQNQTANRLGRQSTIFKKHK